MNKILAVIVTYNPLASTLQSLLNSIQAQVDQVLIIDNHSDNYSDIALQVNTANLSLLQNSTNLGLACAYNHAIAYARAQGFQQLLLLDQDSMPAPEMVRNLASALQLYNKDTLRAAAAGPRYMDIKHSEYKCFLRFNGWHIEYLPCDPGEIVESDHLISSGALIDVRAIDKIGGFTDELFIDYVDTEWCLRARQQQLKLLGVGSANMSHSIGESCIKIFSRIVTLHSPTRVYYQFRNKTWLMKQAWITWNWRVLDTIRSLKIALVLCTLAPNRWANFVNMVAGVSHGLCSRMGPKPTTSDRKKPI